MNKPLPPVIGKYTDKTIKMWLKILRNKYVNIYLNSIIVLFLISFFVDINFESDWILIFIVYLLPFLVFMKIAIFILIPAFSLFLYSKWKGNFRLEDEKGEFIYDYITE